METGHTSGSEQPTIQPDWWLDSHPSDALQESGLSAAILEIQWIEARVFNYYEISSSCPLDRRMARKPRKYKGCSGPEGS